MSDRTEDCQYNDRTNCNINLILIVNVKAAVSSLSFANKNKSIF